MALKLAVLSWGWQRGVKEYEEFRAPLKQRSAVGPSINTSHSVSCVYFTGSAKNKPVDPIQGCQSFPKPLQALDRNL